MVPDNEINLREGYIIGFNQCTALKESFDGKGFVLVTNDFRDTLLAYNLPDTLYNFPPSHFATYGYSFLFPEAVRLNYKVYFSYRILKENEKYYPLTMCHFYDYDISWCFRQIKILNIHK